MSSTEINLPGLVPERAILPPKLLELYIVARSMAYAGGGKYISDAQQPGFLSFKRYFPESDFYFEDVFGLSIDGKKFGGWEITRRGPGGSRLSYYSYAGGLTEEGGKLVEGKEETVSKDEKRVEEEIINFRLKRFLREHIPEARFGRSLNFSFEDNWGIWVYEGEGEINDWGWSDRERLSLNGIPVHESIGAGICFNTKI